MRGSVHVTHVSTAILLRRRANSNHDNSPALQLRDVRLETRVRLVQQLSQAGLMNRRLLGPQPHNNRLILVNTGHVVAQVGKRKARRQANVAGTDDGYLHRVSSSSMMR